MIRKVSVFIVMISFFIIVHSQENNLSGKVNSITRKNGKIEVNYKILNKSKKNVLICERSSQESVYKSIKIDSFGTLKIVIMSHVPGKNELYDDAPISTFRIIEPSKDENFIILIEEEKIKYYKKDDSLDFVLGKTKSFNSVILEIGYLDVTESLKMHITAKTIDLGAYDQDLQDEKQIKIKYDIKQ